MYKFVKRQTLNEGTAPAQPAAQATPTQPATLQPAQLPNQQLAQPTAQPAAIDFNAIVQGSNTFLSTLLNNMKKACVPAELVKTIPNLDKLKSDPTLGKTCTDLEEAAKNFTKDEVKADDSQSIINAAQGFTQFFEKLNAFISAAALAQQQNTQLQLALPSALPVALPQQNAQTQQ